MTDVIKYRTTDLARWGVGENVELAWADLDINFWVLDNRVADLEAALPEAARGIDHFETIGSVMYVHMTDETVLGPYELPVGAFSDQGDWTPLTNYQVLDTFTINGGLYLVLFPHVSAASFDPGASDGSGNPYYRLMLSSPGNSLPTGGAVGQIIEKSDTPDFAVTWGWKTPADGTAGQVLVQQSSTRDDTAWEFLNALNVAFTPVTDSPLTADNVADALEQIVSGGAMSAENVTFAPPSGSGFTANNVADALIEAKSGGSVGRQTIYVPSAGMVPFITNGAEEGLFETSSFKNLVKTLDFDPDTAQGAQFEVAMPKSWDKNEITVRIFWSHPTTATNFGVVWSVYCDGLIDSQTLDTSITDHVTVSATGGTADTLYVTAVSSSVTPVDDNSDPMIDPCILIFQVYREASDGSDTLAVDARLHGIQVYYNIDAATDD